MDQASPNLPSRDFDETEKFYAALGFRREWRDEGWLILASGSLLLEFFPHPALDPSQSWFSCCLRLDDLDGFCARIRAAGVAEKDSGWPRLHAPRTEESGERIAYLIDPDGSLLRLIAN
jgi:catechol 2,3-dioxygenase-like lactoylglutathione lyase family enzyme